MTKGSMTMLLSCTRNLADREPGVIRDLTVLKSLAILEHYSIPTSTLDTLRNDLGLNRAPAETFLRKTHLATCEHMRRMIHTRRAIETVTYNGSTGNRY